jgi:hypothetical protein
MVTSHLVFAGHLLAMLLNTQSRRTGPALWGDPATAAAALEVRHGK